MPPGASSSVASGISGNKITGWYFDGSGAHGFLFDGATYATLDNPLGMGNTYAGGIDGSSIVGNYYDAANKSHGFLFDGTTYTTIDAPLGARGMFASDIEGSNIVGTYLDALNRAHGFLYNGTSFTTLNDPFAGKLSGSGTLAQGISGNSVVGYVINDLVFGFSYDGANFTHPLGFGPYRFSGISGNKLVGSYFDVGIQGDRAFIYTIPEPTSGMLAMIGAIVLGCVARWRCGMSRRRASRGQTP
jgi:hypothetical protein